MSKITITLVLSVFFYSTLSGQDILKDQIKKEGLYKSFYSYRTNNPDIQGDIAFEKSKKGNVIKFMINGDSIKSQNIVEDYWGFCKDSIIYLNVVKAWRNYDSQVAPKLPYYPIRLGSVYSYCLIETNNGMHNISGMFGLVGGLVAVGINELAKTKGYSVGDSIDNFDEIIAIYNKDGNTSVVSKEKLRYLITNNTLQKSVLSEKKISKQGRLEYINQMNKLDATNPKHLFDPKQFEALVTVVRKKKKESNETILIFADNKLVGEMESGSSLKLSLPVSDKMTLTFTTKTSDINESVILELKIKERAFYTISNSLKNPNEIKVKKSDYTSTKYLIDSFK